MIYGIRPFDLTNNKDKCYNLLMNNEHKYW